MIYGSVIVVVVYAKAVRRSVADATSCHVMTVRQTLVIYATRSIVTITWTASIVTDVSKHAS